MNLPLTSTTAPHPPTPSRGAANDAFVGYVSDGDKLYIDGYEYLSDGLFKNGVSYNVSNANGLATLNAMMKDKTAGKNIVMNLTSDIDFAGKTWTPIDSHADTAFAIKEINGKINTSILTVHTYQNVLLDNVDVINSIITGGYKVAPLIATVYDEKDSAKKAVLKNCDVTDTVVIATSYDFCTTGMVAFVNAGSNEAIEIENCTVTNVEIYAPDVYTAHVAVYTTGSETLFNDVEGVTVTNVTFENT